MTMPPGSSDRQDDDRLRAGSVDLDRKEIVALVRHWIDRRQPGAAVRFGEGEGRLIVAEPDDREAVDVARRKIKRQTGLKVGDADVARIRAHVLHAFDEADIVGIRADPSFNEEHLMWVGRIEAAYEARERAGRKAAYVGHCLFNASLHEALADLLRERDKVSVVTCRDVAPIIAEAYEIEDVATYPVPSQFVVRDVDGAFEASLHGVPIWPDHIRELAERLSVREPGEVFLVGAGLFGKHLCIRIRDAGGIALDLGSRLDSMVGKSTRKRTPAAPAATA